MSDRKSAVYKTSLEDCATKRKNINDDCSLYSLLLIYTSVRNVIRTMQQLLTLKKELMTIACLFYACSIGMSLGHVTRGM